MEPAHPPEAHPMRKSLLPSYSSAALLTGLVVTAGCSAAPTSQPTEESAGQALSGGDAGADGSVAEVLEGDVLFHLDDFGGNGRTCSTCHTDSNNGTLSPAQVRALYAIDPTAPIFRTIDSDNGANNSYSRLLNHATIRIHIDTLPNEVPADDPSATNVVFNRGIPTTENTPALDPDLMSDLRAPTLQAQALGAINSHFQPTLVPTTDQLNDISAFEKTLFSSFALAEYAANPAKYPLTFPSGTTPSEKRGETFFVGSAPNGLCGTCHGAPLGNSDPGAFGTLGVNADFIFAGELPTDNQPNPLRNWVLDMTADIGTPCDPSICPTLAGPGGGGVCVTAPIAGCEVAYRDLGYALTTGSTFDVGIFKVPILRNIRNTAPYFHDNSADTLEEVVQHYVNLFQTPFFVQEPILPAAGGFKAPTTQQDVDDIVAYMKLL
jgi:cytochrome c peroxidase